MTEKPYFAFLKTCATYPQRFCFGTNGGRTLRRSSEPGSPGKQPLKWCGGGGGVP